jgi:hypothetical protein
MVASLMAKILIWRRIKLALAWGIGVVTLATAALALIAYKKYIAFPHSSNELVVFIGVYPDSYKGSVASLKELPKEIKSHPRASTFIIVRASSLLFANDDYSWINTVYHRDRHEIIEYTPYEGEGEVWEDVNDANINIAARDGTGFKSFERQGCTDGL